MKNDMVKYCRGQVWFLPTLSQEDVNSKKMSWYLVISSEVSNRRNRLANIIHIKSQKGNNVFPMQVKFSYYNNNYVIDCDKIDTVDSGYFDYGNYEFSLSEDLMNQVTEKLALQFDISSYIPGFDSMLRIVEILGKQYKETIQSKIAITNEQADKICKVALDSIEKSFKEQDIPKINHTKTTSDTTKPKNKTQNTTNKLKTWSDDEKLSFLVDYDSMNKKDLAKKYNMGVSTTYVYKNRFSKQLGL